MTPEAVAELLAQTGLDPARFDLDETAADLAGRIEMSAGLDELVADEDEPALGFDPGWR